jgi:ribosomal protein S18 acetylase RimI-like enzyme
VNVDVRPLTPDRWPDLEALFNAKGCSIPRGCWCMYYRRSGKGPVLPPGTPYGPANRADMHALAGSDPPAGLIGYRENVPVGWVSLGPREDYLRLERSRVMKPVDDQPVWSIICFVVPSAYRHQGVAHALLAGAITFARERAVKILEAYPVDKDTRTADDFIWFGVKSMFDAAGFEEVARRTPTRPVMRLRLA